MKKSSFGNKLLLQVLGVTIFIFGITMFFVTKYSYETAQDDAQKYVSQMAGKYAAQIQGQMNVSVSIVRSIAIKYEEAIKQGNKLDKEETIEILTSILKRNDQLLGIWWGMKDKGALFEPRDDNQSNVDTWYAQNGEFSPYVTRSKGNIILQKGSNYNEENSWIKGPKNAGKTFITKPYIYKIDGVDILMSTIGIPIYKNGQYIGVVGAEIALDTFEKMAKSIKIYENGYSFIVDNYGIILGHPQNKVIAKPVLELVKNDADYTKALENIKNDKEHNFIKESFKDGLESFYYSTPFKINETDVNWGFFITAPTDEYLFHAIFVRNFSIIACVLGLFVIGLVIFFSVRKLNTNLSSISLGLDSFFKYLNKESNNTNEIEINSNDEFGLMAKSINENISKTREGMDQDNSLLEDVKSVANNVSEGLLDKRITKPASNESLNELKNLLNDMLNTLESLVGKDINSISNALSSYTKRDFTAKLDLETSGKIGNEIIQMNRMITHMLRDSQRDGTSLQESSQELTSNVKVLSNNATSQASSLEETAASIDEITSNIEQTSQKAQQMLNISNETKTSATQGQTLATQTVTAMDDINDTVININDAISVIDQIAFQTNILSLNAAVEAATAGEAGKGFAVVAAEVRNLASRSAEAAKEIKELVESATVKANDGKQISSSMIEGFNKLDEKILETSKLIDDVTNAAKEQTIGMTQIADAVGQLDQFTQQNAAIADKTNSIALETNKIALEVVEGVEKNNFDGKGDIKKIVKNEFEQTPISPRPQTNTYSKPKLEKNISPKKATTIQDTSSDDEWESF